MPWQHNRTEMIGLEKFFVQPAYKLDQFELCSICNSPDPIFASQNMEYPMNPNPIRTENNQWWTYFQYRCHRSEAEDCQRIQLVAGVQTTCLRSRYQTDSNSEFFWCCHRTTSVASCRYLVRTQSTFAHRQRSTERHCRSWRQGKTTIERYCHALPGCLSIVNSKIIMWTCMLHLSCFNSFT
jgi:hypothetical protein